MWTGGIGVLELQREADLYRFRKGSGMQAVTEEDVLASRLHRAMRAARLAQLYGSQGDATGAELEARKAGDETQAALKTVLDRGGKVDTLPEPQDDLSVLMVLDSPNSRELLAGLKALLPVAERVDAERGRSLDEVVGGSAGLDLAEDLAQMIARISMEIHGVTGKGLE